MGDHMFSLRFAPLILATAAACAPRGELAFSQQQTTVWKQVVTPDHFLWLDAAALAPASSVCIDELGASFWIHTRAFPQRAEAQLHVVAPEQIHRWLGGMTDTQVLAGAWDEAVQRMPTVVGLPYPPARPPSLQPPTPLQLHFQAREPYFFGPSSDRSYYARVLPDFTCRPAGRPAGEVTYGGALRTVQVVQCPSCHANVDVRERILAPVVAEVWTNFVRGAVNVPHANAPEHRYSIAHAYLLPGSADEPRGGFLFKHNFGVDSTTLTGTFEYEYQLTASGRPTVRPRELQWRATGVLGPILEQGVAGLPGLRPQLGNADGQFVRELTDRIAFDLTPTMDPDLGLLFEGFECDESQPESWVRACAPAAASLKGLAIDTSLVQGRFDAPARARLGCSLGDAASCAVSGLDPTPVLRDRWSCRKRPARGDRPGSKKPYCQFTLPVKRIVPMPDVLELAFFDGPEPGNAAFAFSLFLENTNKLGQLCTGTDPSGPDPDGVTADNPFARIRRYAAFGRGRR
jgi:hypothetical protein